MTFRGACRLRTHQRCGRVKQLRLPQAPHEIAVPGAHSVADLLSRQGFYATDGDYFYHFKVRDGVILQSAGALLAISGGDML